ncbi:MAG: hypothetical protein AAF204_01325, partial [Pseudomonadota bacterium]
MDFNTESEKPQFIYKRNPLVEHAFQIFEWKGEKDNYEPVGEYTLLDMNEDLEVTEKKVANLISIMNGRKRLIELSNLTNERILFNVVTDDAPANLNEKVIFRTYTGDGVSQDNAILEIEKGVFKD